MKSIYIIFPLLMCCTIARAQKVVDKVCDYKKLFDEAGRLAKNGSYSQALRVFNSARRCDPIKAQEVDAEIAKVLDAIEKQNKALSRTIKENEQLSLYVNAQFDALNAQKEKLNISEKELRIKSNSLRIKSDSLNTAFQALKHANDSLYILQRYFQANDLQLAGLGEIKSKKYASALQKFEQALELIKREESPSQELLVKASTLGQLIIATTEDLNRQKKFDALIHQTKQAIKTENEVPDFKKAYSTCIDAWKIGYDSDTVKSKLLEINSLWLNKALRKAYRNKDQKQEIEALVLAIEANDYLENCEFSKSIKELDQFETGLSTEMVNNENVKNLITQYDNGFFRDGGILLGIQQFLPLRFKESPFIQFELNGQKNAKNIYPILPSIYFEHSFALPDSRKFNTHYGFFFQPIGKYRYDISELNQDELSYKVPKLYYHPFSFHTFGLNFLTSYKFFESLPNGLSIKKFNIRAMLGFSAIYVQNNLNASEFEIKIPEIYDQSFQYVNILEGFKENDITPKITADSYFGDFAVEPSRRPRASDSYYELSIQMKDILNDWFRFSTILGVRFENKVLNRKKTYLFGEFLMYNTIFNNVFNFNVKKELTAINQLESVFRENGKTPSAELLTQYEKFMDINNNFNIQLDGSKWFVSDFSARIGLIFRF